MITDHLLHMMNCFLGKVCYDTTFGSCSNEEFDHILLVYQDQNGALTFWYLSGAQILAFIQCYSMDETTPHI
jgi:hypothetical protein